MGVGDVAINSPGQHEVWVFSAVTYALDEGAAVSYTLGAWHCLN